MVPRAHSSCNEHRNDEASHHDPVATGILDTIGVVRVLCHPPEQRRVAQPREYELKGVEEEERNTKDDGSQDVQESLVGFLMHWVAPFKAGGGCLRCSPLSYYTYIISRGARFVYHNGEVRRSSSTQVSSVISLSAA